MPEIEIRKALDLAPSQATSLDTHSFLNLMNVLNFELSNFGEISGKEEELDRLIGQIINISRDLSDPNLAFERINQLPEESENIQHTVELIKESDESLEKSQAVTDSIANMASIFKILRQRIFELQARVANPEAWDTYDVNELTASFTEMLGAIEKNSKGRFRIIYNIAAQQEKDYYVDFKIESNDSQTISIPPIFLDVIRDLIANARKYTQPGGRINAGVWEDERSLVISVEDSGRGIPAGEIEDVVQFGVRGSNVSGKRTFGAGLGLTKAYYYSKRLNGRMWIRSEEGYGTRVKIVIPRNQKSP